MEIVGGFILPDGVHIGIKSFAYRKTVSVKGHSLPFCQGMNHLGIHPGARNMKANGFFHPVEIVVEAGSRIHKQRGAHPFEAQFFRKLIFKGALDDADGILGFI